MYSTTSKIGIVRYIFNFLPSYRYSKKKFMFKALYSLYIGFHIPTTEKRRTWVFLSYRKFTSFLFHSLSNNLQPYHRRFLLTLHQINFHTGLPYHLFISVSSSSVYHFSNLRGLQLKSMSS